MNTTPTASIAKDDTNPETIEFYEGYAASDKNTMKSDQIGYYTSPENDFQRGWNAAIKDRMAIHKESGS